MTSPVDIAGQLLEDVDVATTVDADVTPSIWAIKKGRRIENPDKQVALIDSGGSAPNPRWALDFVHVQVMVRGAIEDYPGAFNKALEVKNALLGIDAQDVVFGADTVRVDGITMIGDIIFLGYDTKERPTFSLNFRIIQERTPAGNRDSL